MRKYKAFEIDYNIVEDAHTGSVPLPLLIGNGQSDLVCLSPLHGRSFLARSTNNGSVILKGCGLSYSGYRFLNTSEMGNGTMGLLLEKDAVRDFRLGNEISALGIKTNKMEYVLKLNYPIYIKATDEIVFPHILQYSVITPWRIEDAPFMEKSTIHQIISQWSNATSPYHICAADTLFCNLRTLHDNGILHNAITTHNYTWGLELLDFELSHSPSMPYEREEDVKLISLLRHREVIHTYQIVNYIAGVLNEEVKWDDLEDILLKYGFDLNQYNVKYCSTGLELLDIKK